MTQHPRAASLTKLIRAVEGAGKPVSAVEVRWDSIEGRDVQVWVLRFDESDREREEVSLG